MGAVYLGIPRTKKKSYLPNCFPQIMKFLVRGEGGGGSIPITTIFNITINVSIFLMLIKEQLCFYEKVEGGG